MKLIRFTLLFLCFLLLPMSIFAQDSADDKILPESTAEAVTMSAAPTAIPSVENPTFVRVVNFSPDAQAISLQVDGEAMLTEGITYPEFSEWMILSAGDHEFSVASSDAAEGESLSTLSANLPAGEWNNLILSGTGSDLTVSLVNQSTSYETPGTARITFVNALSSDKIVNFTRDGVVYSAASQSLDGEQMVSNQLPVDAGTMNYALQDHESGQIIAGESDNDTIVDSSSYLIAAVGTEDNPQLVINETPYWMVQLLTGNLEAPASLLEAAQSDELLAPFVEAVQIAGLEDTLTNGGPYTLFVPADFAMDELLASYRNDPEALATILQNHIVEGNYKSHDVFNSTEYTSLAGNTLTITQTEQGFVNDVQIIETNIPARNGTIHIIQAPLMPAMEN